MFLSYYSGSQFRLDGENEEGKPDFDSPIVKALLEQSSLDVSKPQKTDVPVSIDNALSIKSALKISQF